MHNCRYVCIARFNGNHQLRIFNTDLIVVNDHLYLVGDAVGVVVDGDVRRWHDNLTWGLD